MCGGDCVICVKMREPWRGRDGMGASAGGNVMTVVIIITMILFEKVFYAES